MPQSDLHIWRLTPVADPDDPAWQGRDIWQFVDVASATAGGALLAAARFDEGRAGVDPQAAAQDKQHLNPGFDDLKLYRLDRRSRVECGAGPREGTVIAAVLREAPGSGRIPVAG